MRSKGFIFWAVVFAAVLLVSSAVAVDTSQDEKKNEAKQTNQVADAAAHMETEATPQKEVAAARMETEATPEKVNDVKETIHYGVGGGGRGGGHCRYGCCGRGGPYGCRRCCTAADVAGNPNLVADKKDGYGYGGGYGGSGGYGGGWGGRGGGGGWGGHGGGGWGGGGHGGGSWGGGGHGGGGWGGGGGGWGGGGGGGGGHCRYGCCGGGGGGWCRCCYSAEEARAFMNGAARP